MATRRLGLGTVLSVDSDANASYETITLVVNAKLPTRERDEIDDTTLEDTLQTMSAGIEKHSQYEFELKLDQADTVHTALYTLFGSKTAVNWKVVSTAGTNATWVFAGWVQKYEILSVEYNKHLHVRIVVNRTGAITVS